MTHRWTPGNRLGLWENGDEFFPRLLDVIREARYEIILETFILAEDPVGKDIQRALIDASKRGVWVSVLVDGYGSFYLSRKFIDEMTRVGIRFSIHSAAPRWLVIRTNFFRRMHRKLVVVDNQIAFIGGINFAFNHSSAYGPDFKQDYAAELAGPVVDEMRQLMMNAVSRYVDTAPEPARHPPEKAESVGASPGPSEVLFLTRDNDQYSTAIESQYLAFIRSAKKSVSIANPYFFPGYRFLKGLREAARSGVKVRLLIQGKPGSPLAKRGARLLYDFLLESDIQVYEYWERQFHGKIAAFDDEWSTIGSSNLDPLSFCLNEEANVFIRDAAFNRAVVQKIDRLIEHSKVRVVDRSWMGRRTLLKWMGTILIYHVLRHFPGLSGWLPPLDTRRRRMKLADAQSQRNDSDDGV